MAPDPRVKLRTFISGSRTRVPKNRSFGRYLFISLDLREAKIVSPRRRTLPRLSVRRWPSAGGVGLHLHGAQRLVECRTVLAKFAPPEATKKPPLRLCHI